MNFLLSWIAPPVMWSMASQCQDCLHHSWPCGIVGWALQNHVARLTGRYNKRTCTFCHFHTELPDHPLVTFSQLQPRLDFGHLLNWNYNLNHLGLLLRQLFHTTKHTFWTPFTTPPFGSLSNLPSTSLSQVTSSIALEPVTSSPFFFFTSPTALRSCSYDTDIYLCLYLYIVY